MIVWNLDSWVDKMLVKYSEDQLKELFAHLLRRRVLLLKRKKAVEALLPRKEE